VIKLLAIACGGALGAMSRYGMTFAVHAIFGRSFAYGTLSVNVVGSLLMGFLSVLLIADTHMTNTMRGFLLIGILGAFTTFSTFSLETMTYLESGKILLAIVNILLNVILCLFAVWLGIITAKAIL